MKEKSAKKYYDKNFTNRFEQTGIQYLPEYKIDNRAHQSAKYVPGDIYYPEKPKRDYSPVFPKSLRLFQMKSKENPITSPHRYDIINHHGNVSVKNL